MNRLLRFFLDLCLLRAAPQDAPASRALLEVTLLVYVVLGLIGLAPVLGGIGLALAASLVDAVTLLGLAWIALRALGRSARFAQTATALLGSGALLTALSLPLPPLAAADPEGSGSMELAGVLALLLVIWVQVVIGHILRHALGVSLLTGVLMAIGYVLFANALLALLFPVAS